MGNNQSGILLVVGGNSVPGCVRGACRVQTILKSLDIVLPIFSFVNVRAAELPILVRLINALEETLSLFALREVEEELDDTGAVTIEMLLHVHDGTIPFLPDCLLIEESLRKPLTAENLWMYANDEHLLVVRTIKDADPPAFRQPAGRSPEKIMFQFLRTRLFETENLAAFRINPGHDVPDGAVLTGGVQPLKNQQQGIAVGRVVKAVAANSTPQCVLPEACDTVSSTRKKASHSSASL
jgi:hypothetical protein